LALRHQSGHSDIFLDTGGKLPVETKTDFFASPELHNDSRQAPFDHFKTSIFLGIPDLFVLPGLLCH
jgi:hypothetical protein